MTTLERLRQLHEQASADGDAKQTTILNERESALYVAAYDHLPALLDIAETAEELRVYGVPHSWLDPRTREQLERISQALARLEQP